jgi:hypothetical protein
VAQQHVGLVVGRREQLDGDVPAEHEVVRPVDGCHASAPDDSIQPVAACEHAGVSGLRGLHVERCLGHVCRR